MKRKRGGEQKELMNRFKNGNLMTFKLLMLWLTLEVCVCFPCLKENRTLVTAKADYEIKCCASGK